MYRYANKRKRTYACKLLLHAQGVDFYVSRSRMLVEKFKLNPKGDQTGRGLGFDFPPHLKQFLKKKHDWVFLVFYSSATLKDTLAAKLK